MIVDAEDGESVGVADSQPSASSYQSPVASAPLHPSEAVQPAVTSHHEPEAFELPLPYEAQTDAPVESHYVEEAAAEAAEETRNVVVGV